MPTPRAQLLGEKFYKLTVIECVGSTGRHVLWRCQCDCGRMTVARTNELRDGSRRTCGDDRCRESWRRWFKHDCEYTQAMGVRGGRARMR